MSTIREGTPALVIIGGLALAGVAMGLANPAMASTVAHSVDEADLGVAGAAQQMIIQVGVTFGIQLMQTVQQVREPAVGLEVSYSQAYLAGAVLAVLCVIAAAGVRRGASDPASDGPDVAVVGDGALADGTLAEGLVMDGAVGGGAMAPPPAGAAVSR